jgi:trehalose 6-phosphate phosphatase
VLKRFTSDVLLRTGHTDKGRIGGTLVFFFDFDGTLAEIVPTPEEAGLKPIAKHVIEELARRFPVGIISGRKLDELRSLVGIKGIFYSGNHGVEIEGPGLKFVEPNSAKSSGYITSLGKKIEKVLRPYRPRINSKKYSVSIHYRTLEPAKVKPLLAELDKIISEPLKSRRIDVFHGKKVVEIKAPVDWDKGNAIELIMKKVGRPGTPVFFGDDTTDEFGFRKVNALGGISVFVGGHRRKTNAKYRVGSPPELVGELAEFLFKIL